MSPIKPMLAKKAEAGKVPVGDEYLYEVKWDGLRCVIQVEDSDIRLFTRSGKEITDQYPELTRSGSFIVDCVLDAELVCFDEDGKPSFRTAVGRRHNINPMDIRRRSKEAEATVVLFDVLEADGMDLKNETYEQRREALKLIVKTCSNNQFQISEAHTDGVALYEAVKQQGLEGIIAKRKNGKYYEGRRSEGWLKVKVQHFIDVKIVGYTLGEGRREQFFGALVLEDMDGRRIGKVGTGFNDQMLADLREAFDKIGRDKNAVDLTHETTWLATPLIAEVKYIQKTVNGHLREPVFMRLRTDLLEEDADEENEGREE